MKKRLRRFLAVFAIFVLLLATAAVYVMHRVHQIPEWYHPFALDAATQRQAARDLDDKLQETYAAARELQRRPESTAPSAPISISLTEDAMNSWAAKWEGRMHLKSWMSSHLHLEDAVVILQDHKFILAATSKHWDTLVSLQFEPRLENGKLNLHLSRVMAGTMPVPRWMWSRFVTKGASAMEQNLPALRREAEIGPKGLANAAASDAAMSELALHVLRDEPSEPVLFLPETLGKGGRSLVMQIVGVDISNKTLTVKMAPMSADRREAYFQQLKGLEQGAVGMGK